MRSWFIVAMLGLASVVSYYNGATEVRTREGIVKATRPALGTVIEEIRFKDIHFKQRTLSEAAFKEKKAFVFVAINNGCPLVARYLPRLNQLEKEYRGKGVQFFALNVGLDETILEMATQAAEYRVDFPFVKEIDLNVTQALGLERTPEVVLLDAKKSIRYRGRINDQYAPGKTLPKATREDLKEAIDELLAGKEISTPSTVCEGCKIAFPAQEDDAQKVTYAEHIAPLLNKKCVECHRPNGLAPFSLTNYEQVNRRGEMVAEVVHDGQMPPWYGVSYRGKMLNDRSLSVEERNLVTRWVKAGKPRGDESKFPIPATPERKKDDWNFGEPDLILTTPEEEIPADGDVEYRWMVPAHIFKNETFLASVEIKPSNDRVVHHANLMYMSTYLPELQLNEKMFVTGYVPGNFGMQLEPGIGYRLPPQTSFFLQSHFVTTGKPEKCSLSLGLRFPRENVQQTLRPMLLDIEHFKIPPHTPDFKLQVRNRVLPCDAIGVGFFSHMHKLGKSMNFRTTTPDGKEELVLTVPNYSFDWQLPYKLDHGKLKLPKGSIVTAEGIYDNTAFNTHNHDPARTVRSGMQTYNEMMQGFFFYVDANEKLNLEIDPKTGNRVKK